MTKVLYLCITIMLFTSCVEESTSVSYVFDNESPVDIDIYTGDDYQTVDSSSVFPVKSGESRVFSSSYYRGIGEKPRILWPKIIAPMLVVWNKTDSVLYIADSSTYTGTLKTIDTSSNRTLFRERNYETVLVTKKRNFHDFNLIYTFTEADYEFAKQ